MNTRAGDNDAAPTPGATTDDNNSAAAIPADTATSGGQGEAAEPTPTGPTSMSEAIEAALNADPDAPFMDADGRTGDDADDDDDKGPDGLEGDDDADANGDNAGAGDGKSTADAGDGAQPEPGETGDAATSEDDDPTDEELRAMRPGPRKRIKQLLSQRNAARAEAQAYEADASQYRALRTYMAENRLQDREVADLFRAGAALKSGTPEGLKQFLDLAMPMVQMALEATGQAVPNDLREQIDNGEMTEAAARQLAQARHAQAIANTRAQELQQSQAAQQAQAHQADIASAVNGYIAQLANSDPDFDRKHDVMLRVSQAMVAQKGLPKSKAEALSMAKEAWEETNRLLGANRPQPRPTRPTPNNSSTSSTRNGVKPAPTSISDVINAALEG